MAQNQDWLGLGGKICVITGAGGGIGTAMALGFAAIGAKPVLLDRSADLLAVTADEVARLTGQRPPVFVCDVAEQTEVAAAAAGSVATVGPCDILINNAGLLRSGGLADLDLAAWNALLAVNLTGYFLCAQAFGAQMRGKGAGALVHVASIAASHPQALSGAYSVSKAGVVMLSRQLAAEWGPHGIRSNVVSPGLVETPMSAPFYAVPGVRERRSAAVPAGRIGAPVDIADAAIFLASARAAYVTGEEIGVNGGFAGALMGLIPRPGYE